MQGRQTQQLQCRSSSFYNYGLYRCCHGFINRRFQKILRTANILIRHYAAGRVKTVLESKLTHLLSCKLILIGCTGVDILPVFFTVSSTQIAFPDSKTLSFTSHTVWRKSLTDHKGHYQASAHIDAAAAIISTTPITAVAPSSSPWASRAIISSQHVMPVCVRFPIRIRVSSG